MADSEGFKSGDAVPVGAIPPALLPRVGPDAPERLKAAISRAVLPMPPQELGLALAILARSDDEEMANNAVSSLQDMPRAVLEGLLGTEQPGPVLDVFAHIFGDDVALLQRIVANRSAYDVTIAWMAGNLRGPILDIVASNQVRLVRAPGIIEAMIANPSSPTPILARVIETALRNRVDTTGIVGFKPLAQAFFADLTFDVEDDALAEEAAAQVLEDDWDGDLEHDFDDEDDQDWDDDDDDDDDLEMDTSFFGGLDDSELEALLTGGSGALTEADGSTKPLWKTIGDMSLPQKVRLALLGDATARKLLIRDPKKVICTAVLRSPKLTYKEISVYALDKALDGEIIRQIAVNRQWTRHYSVMCNLVMNPKTPHQKVIGFIKSLRRRDLQMVARAKDVPINVRRAAKNIMDKRSY